MMGQITIYLDSETEKKMINTIKMEWILIFRSKLDREISAKTIYRAGRIEGIKRPRRKAPGRRRKYPVNPVNLGRRMDRICATA